MIKDWKEYLVNDSDESIDTVEFELNVGGWIVDGCLMIKGGEDDFSKLYWDYFNEEFKEKYLYIYEDENDWYLKKGM